MRIKKTKILAVILSISMMISMMSGIGFIASAATTPAEDAIAAIVGYAANDDASALTIAQLTTAGVVTVEAVPNTPAIEANLAAYKAAIALATADQANSIALIQGIVNTVNTDVADAADALAAAIAAIKSYADSDNASALTLQQLADAGVIASSIISVNLGVHNSDVANSTGYVSAIENKTAAQITDTASIKTILDVVNSAEQTATINAIKTYVDAATAANLTITQLAKAGVKTTDTVTVNNAIETNLAAYKVAIAAGTITDTASIQLIITTVNNTITAASAAIAAIEAYNATTVQAGLTIIQLETAQVTGAISGNLPAYKTAIGAAADGAANTLVAIQAFVTTANLAASHLTDIAKIENFNTTNNATTMIIADLTAADVTTNADNLEAYKVAIAGAADGAFVGATPTEATAKIQAIITAVDATQAMVLVIAGYAANDNATTISIADLIAAGVVTVVAGTDTPAIEANLAAYKVAIALATASAADTTSKIQTIIDNVNVTLGIDVIKAYATAKDAIGLTLAQLEAAGVVGARDSNLAAYKTAIEAATDVSTTALIQTIVSAINTATTNATITGVTVGTVVDTIPSGSTDPLYVATFTVTIDPSVTAITPSDFTVATGATVTLYVTSNFSGSVANVAISSNSTTLYAKVMSQDSTVSKFFKVVLNVVNPSQTEYTFALVGTPVSTPFGNVSTISLNAGTAKTGADVVVLAVYTTLSGDQAIVMESIVNGRITVSEPTGNFTSVDLYVFDTTTGDFYGISNNVQFGGII